MKNRNKKTWEKIQRIKRRREREERRRERRKKEMRDLWGEDRPRVNRFGEMY